MDGCDSRSSRSISPTERSDESSRLKMARRLGSAMIANEDSTIDIYPIVYIPVKSYSTLPCRSQSTRSKNNVPATGFARNPLGLRFLRRFRLAKTVEGH